MAAIPCPPVKNASDTIVANLQERLADLRIDFDRRDEARNTHIHNLSNANADTVVALKRHDASIQAILSDLGRLEQSIANLMVSRTNDESDRRLQALHIAGQHAKGDEMFALAEQINITPKRRAQLDAPMAALKPGQSVLFNGEYEREYVLGPRSSEASDTVSIEGVFATIDRSILAQSDGIAAVIDHAKQRRDAEIASLKGVCATILTGPTKLDDPTPTGEAPSL